MMVFDVSFGVDVGILWNCSSQTNLPSISQPTPFERWQANALVEAGELQRVYANAVLVPPSAARTPCGRARAYRHGAHIDRPAL